MIKYIFPPFAKDRGPGFWLRPMNLWASRRHLFRLDNSNQWRLSFGPSTPVSRSVDFCKLLEPHKPRGVGFRFVILGDTGEGDRSQYGLLPLLNHFKPDFMIILGDLANPAGRISGSNNRDKDDYLAGFFEPYRDFNIPIWSVPGNHEYYGRGQGREYYDTFCTLKYEKRWSDYGLRLIPQPGTYWELRSSEYPLVLIGIDTGKMGNLDGFRRKLPPWTSSPPDSIQYKWLEERLSLIDRLSKNEKQKKDVIVLFHIPDLVKGKTNKAKIKTLYRIISGHPCVKHIICGHEHNFQEYNQITFRKYMEKIFNKDNYGETSIMHVINGGGGSALHKTNFKDKPFKCNRRYPDVDQWKTYKQEGAKILSQWKGSKGIVGKMIQLFAPDYKGDGDWVRYLSFILADVFIDENNKFNYTLTPVWVDKLDNLFQDNTVIDILDKNLPLVQSTVSSYKKPEIK